MTQPYKNRLTRGVTVAEVVWRLLGLAALVGCSALGWYLFDLSRRHHFHNEIAAMIRSAIASLNAMLRLDPVLSVIVYPFAVIVLLLLIGLFVWLRRDR